MKKIVKRYIDQNIKTPSGIDAIRQHGIAALMTAALHGHNNVVIILLATKLIDANATDAEGNTALMEATYNDNAKVVNTLLAVDGINVNAKN